MLSPLSHNNTGCNSQDVIWWKDGGGFEYVQQHVLSECLVKSFGSTISFERRVALCIASQAPLSVPCSNCFVDYLVCSGEKCGVLCTAGFEGACSQCMETNCVAPFALCSNSEISSVNECKNCSLTVWDPNVGIDDPHVISVDLVAWGTIIVLASFVVFLAGVIQCHLQSTKSKYPLVASDIA